MVSPIKKKKLCWNCEGSVSFQEENCPYCGVYLSPSEEEEVDEGVNELFDPPYRMDSVEEEQEEAIIPQSPYSMTEDEEAEEEEEIIEAPDIAEEMATSTDEVKRIILPLSLLLSGTVFFLFGLALLLFSRKGIFILQWNGCFWYLYLGFGMMALIVGWRALNQLEEVE